MSVITHRLISSNTTATNRDVESGGCAQTWPVQVIPVPCEEINTLKSANTTGKIAQKLKKHAFDDSIRQTNFHDHSHFTRQFTLQTKASTAYSPPKEAQNRGPILIAKDSLLSLLALTSSYRENTELAKRSYEQPL